ncbi:hypothetical protein DK794_08580 [Escherichia coli]|nr:hypothetical protein [Escherichia coli]EFB2713623.1 hypothetical protein [Escherichia coli O157:H7]EEY8692075.1 hypothetical protein [Escherichia coli]EFA4430914.1 hypothetical protein [Escherichia coli]EFB5118852.1 hypothetical protein [Escherichia coli]
MLCPSSVPPPSRLFSTTTLSDAHRGEGNCFSFFSVGYNHLSCCVSLPANFCPDALFSTAHATGIVVIPVLGPGSQLNHHIESLC